jgi:hypothetical protein
MSTPTNKILQYDLTGDRSMIFGTMWEGIQTPITMTDTDGTVLDGCDLITSVDLYVRDKPDSPTVIKRFSLSGDDFEILSGTPKKLSFKRFSVDIKAGSYAYDIRIVFSNIGSKIYIKGKLDVLQAVTR